MGCSVQGQYKFDTYLLYFEKNIEAAKYFSFPKIVCVKGKLVSVHRGLQTTHNCNKNPKFM